MKISALRFLLCAFVAIALSLNSWAQTAIGQIKAARVEKDVRKVLADGSTALIKNGDALTEKDVVITGKGASVVLVFMNGSSVKLGSDSRLAIDEFKMDPLAEETKMSSMSKGEPTKSKTALNLSYGEVVGDVKKLNTSSTYSIKTPVGAAGIRGTIFRIVFRPDSNGKAFFTISTAEGLVVMQGVTTQDIPVAKDKEVTVEIDVPKNPGDPVVPPKILTQDIPPATVEAIQTATKTITETFQQTSFLIVIPTTEPPPPTPPPPTIPPTPPLTPGAGS